MANFQVNAVVVCDDIRKEITNKDILVGAYGSEIVVHALPTQVRLAFWIELSLKKNGNFDLFLQIEAPNSAPKLELKLTMEISNVQVPVAVFTPPIDMLVEREGKLRLWAKSGQSGKYDLIKTRNMRYEPPVFLGKAPQSTQETTPPS